MSLEIPPGLDLSKVPMGVNPSGAPPNFIDPPSLGPVTYGVVISLMIVTVPFVFTRIYNNWKQYSRMGLDDYFCVLGFILTVGYGGLVMSFSVDETARHTWDIPVSAIDASWLKRNAATCTMYGPSMLCAKMAVFTLYLRLFGTTRWMRWCCWVGIGASILVHGSTIPLCAIYTFPHGDEEWNLLLSLKGTKMGIQSIVAASYNVASDLYLLALPMPVIMSLHLSKKKKYGLVGVFMTGIIGTAATVLGLYFRIYLHTEKGGDATWIAAATYLTVCVELFLAIIVSCIPACASAWKTTIAGSKLVSSLKSFVSGSRFTSSDSTFNNSKKMSSDSVTKLHETNASYELGILPKEDMGPMEVYQLKNGREQRRGIVKSVCVEHASV
ncbi:hypothetical protein K504DRAFT_442482 [Pleomassaria siparia CBS 279.74]|uniref:Rhodopsin domain-containing protein n=1 Tax=Pleomassaria siparia CBS 279.74 TaxID=1314801 RepID=A0A6G1JUP8_9PLEO|nr:hypothetical protein K504DRAFT_442482 [Pleomassaria siparia CBS 279.74]